MPVTVKMPGSEVTLAQRRGAVRTEIDVIGEVKDDFGLTIQNMRDRLDSWSGRNAIGPPRGLLRRAPMRSR